MKSSKRNLSPLIQEWVARHNRSDSFEYRVAISECIHDLQESLKTSSHERKQIKTKS